VLRLALPRGGSLARSRRDKRHSSASEGSGAPRSGECAFQEVAPFCIEVVQQLLAVPLEFGAIAIITCAHRVHLPYRGTWI
jgi:hypothetical protein